MNRQECLLFTRNNLKAKVLLLYHKLLFAYTKLSLTKMAIFTMAALYANTLYFSYELALTHLQLQSMAARYKTILLYMHYVYLYAWLQIFAILVISIGRSNKIQMSNSKTILIFDRIYSMEFMIVYIRFTISFLLNYTFSIAHLLLHFHLFIIARSKDQQIVNFVARLCMLPYFYIIIINTLGLFFTILFGSYARLFLKDYHISFLNKKNGYHNCWCCLGSRKQYPSNFGIKIIYFIFNTLLDKLFIILTLYTQSKLYYICMKLFIFVYTYYYQLLITQIYTLIKNPNYLSVPNQSLKQKMDECHICTLGYLENTNNFLAKCCIKRCNKKFCLNCIREKFDSKFQQLAYKADTYICYSCQNLCNCIVCRGIGSQKKTNKRKNVQISSRQQLKLQTNKQQALENFYNEQQINVATPFMKRIYQRRNHVFKLMANSQKRDKSGGKMIQQKSEAMSKEEESSVSMSMSGKNIRQIVKKTLKNYQDDNDIELID